MIKNLLTTKSTDRRTRCAGGLLSALLKNGSSTGGAIALPRPKPTAKPAPVRKETSAATTMSIDSTSAAAVDARRWWVVVAAMIGAVLEVLDTSITNVAVPQMMGNLGATLSEVGWVSTGYIISNVIVLPMTGWLSDRLSRRTYFTISIMIFTIASLMCGLSTSLSTLIFWRVIQGLGGGGLLATGQVIMLDAFPKSQQGMATAIFGMGVMIGPSLGPVLGGYLTDNLSWPWIFYINLPFGIAAAVLTLMYVPKGEVKPAQRIDFVGIGLLAAGMGSLQTLLERGQEDDWFSSGLIVVLAIVAAVSLVAFVWWELTVDHPIVDLRVFLNRSLAVGSLFGAVLGISLYATLFLLPVYLQNMQGYTAFATGMVLLPSALMSMVSFMMAGPLAQRFDPRKLLAVGSLLMFAGSLGLSQLTTASGSPDLFLPMLLRGASLGFLFIPLTLASLGSLKPEQMGVGSGMINLTRQLGGSVGIAALSTALSRRLDFHRDAVSAHVDAASQNVQQWLAAAQSTMVAHGMDPSTAHAAALAQLQASIERQAMMLSFDDCFLVIAAAFLCTLPLLFLFRKGTTNVDMGGVH